MNETKQPRPESSRELGQWLRSLSAVADPETRRKLNLAAARLELIDPLLAGIMRDVAKFNLLHQPALMTSGSATSDSTNATSHSTGEGERGFHPG